MTNPKVISVGDDFRDWPTETWGSRDRERARAQDRVALEASASKNVLPLAVPMTPGSASAFTLDAPPRPPRDPQAGRDIDDVLFKALEPRR